jgi:membrane protein
MATVPVSPPPEASAATPPAPASGSSLPASSSTSALPASASASALPASASTSTSTLASASLSMATRARRAHARSITARLHELVTRTERRPLYAVRVLIQVIKQWVRDRCPQQASSLAFGTALSLVPLIAVCLALLRASGEFRAESSLVDFLARQVLPVSRDDIARYLVSWAGNMSFQTAGIAGVVTTTTLAFLMYYSVEQIFNDIWRVERRRSLSQKFVVFYAVFTMVPALLGYSLYQATQHGLTEGVLGWVGALVASFGALFLANKLLPATQVRWGAAAIGALFSALAFEAAKNLFHLYVAKVAFQSYAGVYGTLGLVPISLLWIYYSWLVVLLGAEIAHAVQNLHHLERRQGDEDQIGGVAAARLLVAIVQSWRTGERALPRGELQARFQLTDEALDRMLHRLRDAGLVMEVEGDTEGYLPARPPDTMTLAEVLSLFRGGLGATPMRPPGAPAARLDEALADLERSTRERTAAITMDELAR